MMKCQWRSSVSCR